MLTGCALFVGVQHNISMLRDIITEKRFVKGDLTTNYLPEVYPNGFTGNTPMFESTPSPSKFENLYFVILSQMKVLCYFHMDRIYNHALTIFRISEIFTIQQYRSYQRMLMRCSNAVAL